MTREAAGGGRPARFVAAVTDDGPGIAPQHLPRLTERFYRVSAAASREKGGTGLGLAIVKHILNRHRGELDRHLQGRRGLHLCRGAAGAGVTGGERSLWKYEIITIAKAVILALLAGATSFGGRVVVRRRVGRRASRSGGRIAWLGPNAERKHQGRAHARAHRQVVRPGAAAARQEDRADGRPGRAAAGAGLRRPGAARSQARRGGGRQRPHHRPARARAAGADHPDDRPAPAHGQRPAPHHDRAQDRRRPGAHRRSRQEHRQARARRLRREPPQAADDRPQAHDRAGDGPAPRRARRLRRARCRQGAAGVAAGRAHRRHVQLAVPRAPDLHDGRPAQHRPVHASAVRRQEHRARRRPHHQHRRERLLPRARHGRSPTTGRRATTPAPR